MTTISQLQALPTRELEKKATGLGVKGARSIAKPILAQMCFDLLNPAEESVEEEITQEEAQPEPIEEEIPEAVQEEIIEEANAIKNDLESVLESSLFIYDGKEYNQIAPVKKIHPKGYKVIRKADSSVVVLDPEGEILIESRNYHRTYLKVTKIAKEAETKFPISIYFDVEIPKPAWRGKNNR